MGEKIGHRSVDVPGEFYQDDPERLALSQEQTIEFLQTELDAERKKVRELGEELTNAIETAGMIAKRANDLSDECEMLCNRGWRRHVEAGDKLNAERALSEERRVMLEGLVTNQQGVVTAMMTARQHSDIARLIQPSTEEKSDG